MANQTRDNPSRDEGLKRMLNYRRSLIRTSFLPEAAAHAGNVNSKDGALH
jgi:hypothetical protein